MSQSEAKVGEERERSPDSCLGEGQQHMRTATWSQDRARTRVKVGQGVKVLHCRLGSQVLQGTTQALQTDLPSPGPTIILMLKNVERIRIQTIQTVPSGMSMVVYRK